jgi:uncharacterized membrane protein
MTLIANGKPDLKDWAGRCLTGFVGLFLLVDGVMKLVKPPVVVQANVRLGYSESLIVWIGLTLIVCTIIYLIPRTVLLGTALLTGYLGGALASQLRAGSSLFESSFPILVGAMVWAGLLLRRPQVLAALFGKRADS